MVEKALVRVQLHKAEISFENLWSTSLTADHYRIESIPFFAYGIALHDIVLAKPGPEGWLQYLGVVERSGNRTLRAQSEAFVSNLKRRTELMANIERLGCEVELHGFRLLAINIPPTVELGAVTWYLAAPGVKWEYGHPEDLNKQAGESGSIQSSLVKEAARGWAA